MTDAGLAVRKTLTVNAPQDRAFQVFWEEMSEWWPLNEYSIGDQPAVEAIIEPRPGGRWYERAGDRSEREWGHVLTWQPPERLVLSWEISADWVADSSIQSEVDVRFFAEGPECTRVELGHRHLTTFGDRAAEMHGIFDSERGWEGLLALYSAAATTTSPTPTNATTPGETER